MHLEKIEALVGILRDSNVGELELTEGTSRIRLTRHDVVTADHREGPRGNDIADGPPPPAPASAEPGTPAPDATHDAAAARATVVGAAPAKRGGTTIAAPLFGVVHLAPAPGEPSFVAVGDRIREGDTLCTIEAMKTFNVIEAEQDGVITEILVRSGQEVALGVPLFRVAT